MRAEEAAVGEQSERLFPLDPRVLGQGMQGSTFGHGVGPASAASSAL